MGSNHGIVDYSTDVPFNRAARGAPREIPLALVAVFLDRSVIEPAPMDPAIW